MHIVQVSAYYPPHLGGQEYAVQSLANQLTITGHRVDVITSAGQAPKGWRTEGDLRVLRLGSAEFGHAPIMPALLSSLAKTATDHSLVHLHIGQAFAPEIVWLASKIKNFKYIAHLHIDFEPSGPLGFLLPLYKNLVLPKVIKSAAAVVVLNQPAVKTVRDQYGYKGPIKIINNGIDEAFFTIKRKPFSPSPPKTIKLLFVGRLTKQKNVPALLKALALTKRPVQLNIVGEGEEISLIKATIDELGLGNVTLNGRLPRDKVMPLYGTYDALVMPSLYEAQPLVLLEAQAARIPIIGTNVVGVADHLRGNGIIVEPTAKGLAEGIAGYDSQYAMLPHLVEQAYNQAVKHRWSTLLKDYEALYEQVAAS